MRLDLIASDPGVRDDIRSAKERLAHELAGTNPRARAAIAALALGDFDSAASLARALGASQRPDGTIPGEATATYIRLLTQHLAWTGEMRTIRDQWTHIQRATASPPSPSAQAHEIDSWIAARNELAIAAESIGKAPPPMELPGSYRTERELRVPEPGAGLAPRSGEARDTADLVDYYLRDILGVEPDAPKNRLVLRPRLPEEWDHLDLRRLRFGDAEIDLSYRRAGDRHHFSLVQESGAIPVRVIFEPELPGARLVAASVDGEDAELAPRAGRSGVIVPVQIVLDDLRSIELEIGREAGRTRISLPVRHPTG